MAIEDIQLHLVRSWDDACEFKRWLGQQRDFLAVDVETTGLNVGRDRIRLCQFGDHSDGWAFDYADWRGLIRETIENYRAPMVAHNLLYDSKMLKKDGVVIPQQWAHDTMVMVHLKDAAAKMDLKGACVRYVDKRSRIGQGMLSQAMAAGGWDWGSIPLDHPAYWTYACLDTCLTSLLAASIYPETGGGPYRRAYELELGCIHVLREAEIAGMLTDPVYRQAAAAKLHTEIEQLRPQIPIRNPGSDAQVVSYLQSVGAPLIVKTEAGKWSVDKYVLRWLAPNFPICTLIEQYRSKARLLSNYFNKMDELAVNDVVHANTRPVEARTSRMSVTDPPLQTLPRGRVVRDAFIARPGHAIVAADFMGMEMRALASDAGEQSMLAAYSRGEDLHDFVAAAIYGPEFTKPQRTTCKNAGFAKIYGAGLETFAVTAEIDVPTAKAFLDRYDGLFPGVRTYMEKMVAGVIETAGGHRSGMGYVELIDGRRLPVEASKAYKATNYRIQGSCGVVLKQKLVELAHAGLEEYFRLPVHDEGLFECPIEDRYDVQRTIDQIMPDRISFPGVVLETESTIFDRWGQNYASDYPEYLPTEPAEWNHDFQVQEAA